jgi:diguanylate cyclase (GGDEF)-like protein
MGRRAGFREVLAIGEFRALWFAELLSVCGDQLARVGLAVLVYTQTSSATWTALTYALTFLPALVGGVLLGGLADRYPRRQLMIYVEVVRAVLAALMAIPALPLPVLLVLVFLLTLGGAPFKAAQQALLPTVLQGDRYISGLALRTITGQSAQIAGFLGGGALVAVLNAHATLALNGFTFLASGIVIAAGVRRRPAARAPRDARSTGAATLIWRDRRLRGLVALSWLVGLFVIPEGLAAPYAAGLGATVAVVGVLMAADPVGSVVGAWLVARIPAARRETATTLFAVCAGVPLALCLVNPPLAVVVVLWALSGACSTGYLVLAQASFVLGVPDHHRGAATGLAAAGVLSSQGVAVLGAGLLADLTSPMVAVATGGVAGVLLTGVVGMSLRRARSRRVRSTVGASGREDIDADHETLTNPCSTFVVPPPDSDAAEHGNGLANGDERITSPGSTSITPPPGALGAQNGHGTAEQLIFARSVRPASLSTDQRSRVPWRWALWRESGRVLSFIIGVEVAAVALTAYLAVHSEVRRTDLVVLGILVGLGLMMGELTRHVERVRRRFTDTPHVNLTSVWTFSAALVLPPALIPVVVGALYAHLFWRSWYRVRSVHAYRLVFTATTVTLSALTARAIQHLLAPGGTVDWDQPAVVAGTALAIVAYSAVNSGLVGLVITLHELRLDRRRALGTLQETALEYGTLGLGAITALLISVNPGWALMIVPALLVLHRSVLIRQLEEAASTDQKTGLANATAWTNLASAEIQRARRDETQVGVLMVDLDHFKQVNDLHGHLVGDRVLQVVANQVATCARRYDVLGRWGGEEFVMLCPEVSAEGLRQIGERVCERVRALRVPVSDTGDGVVEGLSVSVGMALYPEFGPELQDVLLAADDALFVAKDSGRNQVQTIIAAIGDLSAPRAPSQGS